MICTISLRLLQTYTDERCHFKPRDFFNKFQPQSSSAMASETPAPDHCEFPALEFENSEVNEEVDPQAWIQRVGRLLQTVIMSKDVSRACLAALKSMADSGQVLDLPFVEEIKRSGALTNSVNSDWGDCQVMMSCNLIELRTAMAACVAATATSMPVIELMTLWSVVHEAITEAFIEKSEALFKEIAVDYRETLNNEAIGKLLVAALSASTHLASIFTRELREAIQALANFGTSLAEQLTTEVHQHLPAIQEALSEEDWGELYSHCLQATTSQWQALAEAASKIGGLATEEITLAKHEAHKVFDSPFSKAIADQGLSGFDGVFGQSRETVDAALEALRGGGIAAAGTVAACLARAGLPPLLRLEIARDFFQTAGLFFSGLYTSALNFIEEHDIATDMSRILNGVRSIYDVVSINVLEVVENASLSRALMIDIAMWLLIAAVGAVYLSFLWFAYSGRHLHRRDDEVRQGHEADTWAELATKQKTRVSLFTYVITACLTIYLPLTRLCLDIVVEFTTHRISNAAARVGNSAGYNGGNTGTYGGNTGYNSSSTGNNGYYNGFSNASGVDNSSYFANYSEITSSGFDYLNGSSIDFDSSSSYGVVNVSSLTSSSTVGNSASELVVTRFQDDESVWLVICILAAILLATFTLPLPKLLVRVIAENRPTGSLENAKVTHDLDGEEVPFDDKVYERLVQRDPNQLRCPYRSLYAGFEQRWSYYKVLQLVVKLVLALVIALTASDDMVLRASILCAFYACVVALTSYSTPFTDPLNNVMEISGKLTALATCIGGLVAVCADIQRTKSRTLEIVAIVVSTAHLVNFFVMLVVLLLGMPAARLWVKNLLGWITFSDTCRGIDDAPGKNVLPLWDLEREAKHRVWHGFWRALLLEVAQNTTHGAKEMSIVDRLTTLEQAIVASGIHRVRAHWRGEEDAHNAKLRQTLRSALEGVDVYWDDATGTRDGHLDSTTCFGKMYVVPYPFHCVVVYDDCKDETIIRDDVDDKKGDSKLAKLLFLNFTPRIMVKRDLRHKLRVLSDEDTSINFPFSRLEQVTVPDGVVQTTDVNGTTHTHPRFSTVTFTCYYTNGVIGVGTNGDAKGRIMAEGFRVSMTYRDGHGKAVAPHTGIVFEQSGRVAVMGAAHIGLTSLMVESEELRRIFEQTKEVWEPGVPELREKFQEYRRGLQVKHAKANATLTDAFWYFVYNNSNLSREKLEKHFKRRETNPRLKLVAATHQVALDSLYLRMQFIHSHPSVTFWYIFWNDVYVRNSEMRRLRKFKPDLDPRQPTAICYHVMRRPELEMWLNKRQLLGTRRLFHPSLLDLLYQEMEKRLESKQLTS